jgi:hypothetical protein
LECKGLKTPVAFIIFNRPQYAYRVFEAIRKARPPLLLVIADGPREGHLEDREDCQLSRALIDQADWDCEVRKNYSEANLGCGRRVASGITWVFDQVEEAIILEDDCVPDPTFFRFCEELLERYRKDERISQIGGVNYQGSSKTVKQSYYFSRYHYVWGLATWRRAWKGYDFQMELWPALRDKGWLAELFEDKGTIRYYTYNLDKIYQRRIDTWAYQWFFHCWANHRLSVLPGVNLVSNIGYDQVHATHTKMESRLANVPAEPIPFPLIHPPWVMRDLVADRVNEAATRYALLSLVYLVYQKQKWMERIGWSRSRGEEKR